MLQKFRSGKYKFNPLPKYMFLVEFSKGGSSIENSSLADDQLANFGIPGSIAGFGAPTSDRLSSLVESVNLATFSMEMENLDKVGVYGIRVPKGVAIEPLKISMNLDKSLSALRFHDALLANTYNINHNSGFSRAGGSQVGAKRPRSAYEIDIKIGLYSEKDEINHPIIRYTYHNCVYSSTDSIALAYSSKENVDSVDMEFYPNGGMTVEVDAVKLAAQSAATSLIGALAQAGTAALTALQFWGMAALDMATNQALRGLSVLVKDGDADVAVPQIPGSTGARPGLTSGGAATITAPQSKKTPPYTP